MPNRCAVIVPSRRLLEDRKMHLQTVLKKSAQIKAQTQFLKQFNCTAVRFDIPFLCKIHDKTLGDTACSCYGLAQCRSDLTNMVCIKAVQHLPCLKKQVLARLCLEDAPTFEVLEDISMSLARAKNKLEHEYIWHLKFNKQC